MTKDEVRTVLDRVLTWAPNRQADAVRVLAEMEAQDASALSLTKEQAAEVERRRADPLSKTLTIEEVRERFALRRS
jgi:hypothetical protein